MNHWKLPPFPHAGGGRVLDPLLARAVGGSVTRVVFHNFSHSHRTRFHHTLKSLTTVFRYEVEIMEILGIP